ncbi:type I-E CRISPR-associated protein Cse2/CasB [Actinomadura chibensis]|uniref:Type I-E CRISPR-associated protein Cse2/CasB n=1 Tax=Actinomadura chibensis TaxID=392828 RepID=A0A5D0NMJ2_9ACTN|nr:type I-E CRISPR-associated protein Cse2/CasB [Actinomadura chibensis]TYB45716.1 type I-E CRISPR-associated protein Cse2/CasB [Actinomadura chibensis]
MTAPIAGERQHVSDLVGQVVGDFVDELQDGYLRDTGAAVARLAQLRRGAGKLPQDVPELWGLTGTERLYQDQTLGEQQAVRAENASFLAVTLYALHQQSRTTQKMHIPDADLGAAVRQLMPPDRIDEPIRRRFVRVGTAGSPEVLAYRLREIVSLLRRDSIPLDYALLAKNLYRAHTPDGLARVRRQWGRGFHAYRPQAAGRSEQTPQGEAAEATTDEATTDKDVT